MQKYATTGVNVTYQEVLSKGVRGGDMFGRKRSSIPGGGGGLIYETDGDARRLA